MEDRRIVLTGYRGTGKSSVGKALSLKTGKKHVDTDEVIEKISDREISQIFALEGESTFRDIEQDVIANLPSNAGVISTGGGAVLRSSNVARLRKNSLMVLLTASPEVISKRIAGSGRPSLTGVPAENEVKSVLSERMNAYRSAADIIINTDKLTPEKASEKILRRINQGIWNRAKRDVLISSVNKTRISDEERVLLANIALSPDIFLYGILGNPSMHSKSPGIYNQLFSEYRIPGHYTWFEYKDPHELFGMVSETGVRGISVTIPHKKAVIPYLDEIKHDAENIEAVNTILILDEKRYGYNTDWKGIYRPLEGTTGETAVILGAGGGAAAAAYAVMMRGFKLVILNRTPERALQLARKTGAETGALSDIGRFHPDLLINTTPAGMGSDTTMPIPASSLKSDMKVFDLVYTPKDTPLLKAALASGCSVIPGTEMFVHQLAEQFRIFTGIEIPVTRIREMVG